MCAGPPTGGMGFDSADLSLCSSFRASDAPGRADPLN
jgi:hypothetical protein